MSPDLNIVGFSEVKVSQDGSSLIEGNVYPELFQSIIIGRYEYNNESIVCLPSQIGCRNGCKICFSGGPFLFPGGKGQKGFLRNLRAAEVVHSAIRSLELSPPPPDSKGIIFSFMGMGEPFDNIRNMKLAMEILGQIYPESRFTYSTIAKNASEIKKLADQIASGEYNNLIKLHISLHAADDEKRRKIVPMGLPIRETLKTAEYFAQKTGTVVKLNYVFLEGFNDRPEDIDNLVNLLIGKNGVSLMVSDFNSKEELENRQRLADEFADLLRQRGITVDRFISKGVDIQAGCGQLTFNQLNAGDSVAPRSFFG